MIRYDLCLYTTSVLVYVAMRAYHLSVIQERAKKHEVDLTFNKAYVDVDGKTVLCFRGVHMDRIINVIQECSPYARVRSHYCDYDGQLEVCATMPSDVDLWAYGKARARAHPLTRLLYFIGIVLIVGGVGGLATLL